MAPSPDRIKLTLQHKLLEYKQVEVQNSNMKKALDNDSHIVSHQRSTINCCPNRIKTSNSRQNCMFQLLLCQKKVTRNF